MHVQDAIKKSNGLMAVRYINVKNGRYKILVGSDLKAYRITPVGQFIRARDEDWRGYLDFEPFMFNEN